MTTQAQSNISNPSTPVSANKDQLLRNTFRANSTFSAISGAAFIIASAQIADFLGIKETDILGLMNGSTFLLIMGIGLLIFAGEVYFVSSRQTINKTMAWEIVVMDITWVLGSAILLVTEALPLTTEGSWAVLIVADIVATFAVIQYFGIRRMSK